MANTNLLYNTSGLNKRTFLMIDNYIYLHHVDKYIVLPSFIDSVNDSQQAQFNSSTPLARSAPIYSYASSGPRTVQVVFNLHRDLLYDINKDNTSIQLSRDEMSDDYVDLVIKYIQASVLPAYEESDKMVNPPLVSLRLGNDIFIKGVIDSGLGITYKYPILSNGRYADVQITFRVSEVDPYDANMVLRTGSFRNLSTTLERAGDSLNNISSPLIFSNQNNKGVTNTNKNVNLLPNKNNYPGHPPIGRGGGGQTNGSGAGRR